MKWHLFKKSKPVSQIDASMMLVIDTKVKSQVRGLSEAMKLWEKDKNDELIKRAPLYELYNDSGVTSKEFQAFFSPYAFESFLTYYKSLVDRNEVIYHTDGEVYKPALANVAIYYNHFLPRDQTTKDAKGNTRRILDVQYAVYKYKADKSKGCIISDNFVGNLVLIYRLIFFYNYSVEDLANRDDPEREYHKCKRVAKFVYNTYKGQRKLNKQQRATTPSLREFEQQKVSSVVIPALVSPDVNPNPEYSDDDEDNAKSKNDTDDSRQEHGDRKTNASKPKQNDNQGASATDSQASDDEPESSADNMSVLMSLKAESESISKAEAESESAKNTQPSSAESVPSSASQSAENTSNPFLEVDNQRANEDEPAPSQSVASYSSASQSNVSPTDKLKSEASYYKSVAMAKNAQPNSEAVQNQAVATTQNASAGAVSNTSSSADLVDIHKYAKSHFPITNKPSVVQGAIQLLMDKDPNMFHPDFSFQRFDVNNNMPAPMSVHDAIKTGKLDNQKYVIQLDNQNKKIANAVITSRAKVLNMGYTRMLTDLLYGAYTKIGKKTSILLRQTQNDKTLVAQVRDYYNKHYNEANAKLEKGRKTELGTVHKALYDEYMSKKRLKDNKINSRYDKEKRQLDTKMSALAKDVYYKARSERNKELRQQISDLTRSDMKKVRLQIKNHNIEWAHKMSQASKLLFNFLHERLQTHHNEAVRTVSKLISKQAEIIDAKANMRQARATMLRNRGNRQLRAKWAKTQAQQQAYINKLNGQVDQYTGQLTQLQISNRETKSKMKRLIVNNKSLQTQLDNANDTLVSNQKEIAQGRADHTKLNEAKAQSAEQQRNFASERASYSARNRAIVSKTASTTASATTSASVSASSSALARIHSNELSVIQNNNSYQAKIFALGQSLSNAKKAESANKSRLQTQLSMAQNDMSDYRNSVASSNLAKSQAESSRNSSMSASVAQRNQSYQSDLSLYARALNSASQAQGNATQLQSQLVNAQNSLQNYRKSVSASNSVQNSSFANYSASMSQSVVNRNNSYQTNLMIYSRAFRSASEANNGDKASFQSRLDKAKNSLTNYRNSVAQSNSAKSEAISNHDSLVNASVASRNASYQSKMDEYSMSLSQASQATGDASRLQNQLNTAKSSLVDYRASVSASNSAKNSSIASYNHNVDKSISARNASYQANMNMYSNALDKASQANGDTARLQSQLSVAQNSFADYRASVSASNSTKNSLIASHDNSVNQSIASRNASYQSNLNDYASALNSASQANGAMVQLKSQLSFAQQSLKDYQTSVANSNSAKSVSVAKRNSSVSDSIASHNISYHNRLKAYKQALSSASQTNADTSGLLGSLNNAKQSMARYRASVSASNSEKNSQIASYNNSVNASVASRNASYQNNLDQYKRAVQSASQTNTNVKLATDQLNNYKQSLADYKQRVAQSDSARDAQIADQQISASNRDDSYKARIDGLMSTLTRASQANGDTESAQAELSQYKSSFSSFQSSVSTANSLRDTSLAKSNANRNESYQATIARMKSNEDQASKANSLVAKTNATNASFTSSANAQASQYRSTIDSYKASFARYKSSVSASQSTEKKSVSASNSTTSSMMSSATFSSNTNTGTGANQTYNPEADRIEQERLLKEQREKQQAVQSKHVHVQRMHKKSKKKKHLWEL